MVSWSRGMICASGAHCPGSIPGDALLKYINFIPMNNLLKKRNEIESMLNSFEEDEKQLSSIDYAIEKKRKELKKIDASLKSKKDLLEKKKQAQINLKSKITFYKKSKLEIKEKEAIKKIDKIISRINLLDFITPEDFSINFEKLNFLYAKSVPFEILCKKIKKFSGEQKERIIKILIDELKSNNSSVENAHKLAQSLQKIIDLEKCIKRKVIKTYLIGNICEDTIYHFLSNKETNRLDKPEWFFTHLGDKIKENKRIILVYTAIEPEIKIPLFKSLFRRICDLIQTRFNEILKSKSTQKKNLMVHFCVELIEFKKIILKEIKYEVEIQFIANDFIKEIKQNINEKMEQVHLGNYKKWFQEYKIMLKDAFNVYLSVHDLDSDIFAIICQHIIDNIYIYCEIFIKQMRYINREEIHLLCLIFSELENIKFYITDLENEFINLKFSEKFVNIQKISIFNSENLKLIKSLVKNDTDILLKRIKNIKYIQEKILVNFVIDLSSLLIEYKETLEKGYQIIEKCIGMQIDNFFINQIILKNTFESVEYFEFKDFFKKVFNLFDYYKEWNTITGCKCIEDIFNGRTPKNDDDSLFNLIYENYID
ncbi:hypothetical protein COBT_002075 [Conglomerata obtusa]